MEKTVSKAYCCPKWRKTMEKTVSNAYCCPKCNSQDIMTEFSHIRMEYIVTCRSCGMTTVYDEHGEEIKK